MMKKQGAGDSGADMQSARESGFTLVVVLCLVALLTLILIGFQRSAGTHVNLASNAVVSAQAEALAEAGIHQAVLDLLAFAERKDATSFAALTSPKTCAAGPGEVIETRIEDVAGRIDLNAASEPLLAALLAGLGASAPEASSGAAAIADYRDRDNQARAGGAEAADYAQGQLKHAPRNAPLQTTEELESVFGFSLKRVRELLPYLTVHSGLPGIDPGSASPQLKSLIAKGQSILVPGGGASPQTLPPEFMSASPRQSFIVISQGEVGGARFVREAVVAVGSGRTRAFAFKSWKQGGNAVSGSRAGTQLELCPGVTGS